MASRSMQSALANYSRLFNVVFTCDDLQRRQTDGTETTSPLFIPVMIWRGGRLMKVRQLHCENPTILNCFGQLTGRQGESKGRQIILPSCACRQVPKRYSAFPPYYIWQVYEVIILSLIYNIITKFEYMYTSAWNQGLENSENPIKTSVDKLLETSGSTFCCSSSTQFCSIG